MKIPSPVTIKREMARYIFLLWGLFLIALGVYLMIEAQIGAPPWDAFHVGLYQNLGFLTLGQIIQGIGFLLILISFALGVRPDASSILNMIFVGLFIDLLYYGDVIPIPENIVLRLLVFIIGCATMGFGTASYMSANRGAGPRDSLMVALSRITGLNMGLIRTMMEILVTFGGFLLGGPIGVGTLIFALSIGSFMQLSFRFYRWMKRTPRFHHLYQEFFAEKGKTPSAS